MTTDEYTRSTMQAIASTASELRRRELDYLAVRIIEKLNEAMK